MSALARYFMRTGKQVAGYDRTPTELTRQLTDEGISVHYEDAPGLIPVQFSSVDDTWVVITPAVPADNAELNFLISRGYTLFKRSEMLGQITRDHKTVAVAGTHGKTTVSTMIAYILSQSKAGCNAFLGGISKNFNSNLVLHEQSDWMVTEADEFDRSFLRLYPYAAVVTAMDPDHLDIYGTEKSMQEAFQSFIDQVNPEGVLLVKSDLPLMTSRMKANTYTYSLNGKSDFYAENILLKNRRYYFELVCPGMRIKNLSLEHPGLVNVENAVAAASVASLLKIDEYTIRNALATFTGIQRRFDYQVQSDSVVYIDDYAHHPKEIEATLKSVRELYPDKKITGIFQPHLYSRTRDFAGGFAESLSLLDRLLLLDIYPARELPIAGVTSEIIFRNVSIRDKIMCKKDDIIGILGQSDIEVLITLGAGDIDKLVQPVKKLLLKRIKE